jgi:hypothetical protein
MVEEGLYSTIMAFELGGIMPKWLRQRAPSFSNLVRRTTSFSRLPRRAKSTGISNLTRIPMEVNKQRSSFWLSIQLLLMCDYSDFWARLLKPNLTTALKESYSIGYSYLPINKRKAWSIKWGDMLILVCVYPVADPGYLFCSFWVFFLES